MQSPPNHSHQFRRSLFIPTDGDRHWFAPGPVLHFDLGSAPTRVQRLQELFEAAGVQSPDALRERFELPPGRWLCRPMLPIEGAPVRCELEPLHAALLLGLSGPALYAPDRPLILTETRLARHLQLHCVATPQKDSCRRENHTG